MTGAPKASHHELFTSLQAGRAIAALLVLMYHNSLYIFALDKYWGHDPSQGLFKFSHSGVEFFFVLSGFIILHIHWNDLGNASRFFSFVRKRFIRIYPIYWLVLALVVPVYFFVPSFGFPYHREISHIVSSVILVYLGDDLRTEIAVAWTLYHEILFYFMFSLAIFSRRFGFLMLAAWFLASVGSLCSLFAGISDYFSVYLFSPLHLLFGMGMFSCWLLRHRYIPLPAMMALLGISVFLGAGWVENSGEYSEKILDLFYGLGSALAVIGAIELERQGRLRIPGWLRLMGDASYSIYLTHFTLLSMTAKIFVKLGALAIPTLISFILLPILVVLMGIAVHLLVERPLLRKLQRYRGPKVSTETMYSTNVRTSDVPA